MISKCGYIALVGRPNVGKSTLLNKILKQKLSITSRKPQTTRHAIRGVYTKDEYQMIFVDTPGVHQTGGKEMHKLMNQAALTALYDVDVIVFLVDPFKFNEEDERVLANIKKHDKPCILAVNKIDKLADKDALLPTLEALHAKHDFTALIPLSAKTGKQVETLLEALKPYMPEGPHLFDEDDITDRSARFLCAELLREKIFRLCGQELPYATTVEIESFAKKGKAFHIQALIMVDKENHKRMIIGERGQKLKAIASQARLDMERLIEEPVFLKCFCKVKSGWSDDMRTLRQLGYDD